MGLRAKPLGIQVMNGSLHAEGKTPALAVFVSRSNPVRQLSMSQLARILGCPVDPKEPVTWALAGAEGVWRNRRIHAFLYDDQTGTGAFLQRAIQGTKDCWNWGIVREFKDTTHPDGSAYPAAQQIVDALKHDVDGLAISTLGYADPKIKALPLAASGAAVPLTRETVTSCSYPLGRGVYVYINRGKDQPVDPKVKEFLRFILSREGQALVQNQDDYLPLDSTTAQEQWKKLE
jgi:phosphate transport system substrate-binding protein